MLPMFCTRLYDGPYFILLSDDLHKMVIHRPNLFLHPYIIELLELQIQIIGCLPH